MSPVLSNCVDPAARVPTLANGPPALVARSIWNAVSFAEASVQVTRIDEDESATAAAPVGAAGGVTVGASVVAVAVLDQAEAPAALVARTRK